MSRYADVRVLPGSHGEALTRYLRSFPLRVDLKEEARLCPATGQFGVDVIVLEMVTAFT